MANTFYWYMARSAGFTSYAMLSLTVLLGLSSSIGLWDKLRLRRFMTQMHQYTALLVLPFLFFHLWGLNQDTTIPFTWETLLVPFLGQYRQFWTGLGILTLYGWILIVVSSYLRERIGTRMWRAIHLVSIPMFIAVTVHGLMVGTDSKSVLAVLIYALPSALFVGLVWKRLRD